MHQSLTVGDLQLSQSTCSWILKVVHKSLGMLHPGEKVVELSVAMNLEKEGTSTLAFDRVHAKHNESL